MDVSNHTQGATSHSESPTSSNSDLDKDINELDLNGSEVKTNGDKNGAYSGVSGGSGSVGCADDESGTGSAGSIASNNKTNTLKKRISSSRTPTRKAKRVRFFRNGDRFYAGIMIPVSNDRYRWAQLNWQLFCDIFFTKRKFFCFRSFESLCEDLTRLLEDKVSGAVRNIYSVSGKKVS